MTKPYGLQTTLDGLDPKEPLYKDHFFETEEGAVAAARQFLTDNPDAPHAAAHVLKVTRGDYTFLTFRSNGEVIERWGGYESARKYRVTNVSTVEEFLDRYYKKDRITHMLKDYPDYRETLLASYQAEFDKKGYTVISRHDNVTGEPVAFYGPAE